MKDISAIISWKNAKEGGRSQPIDLGVRYFPTIIRDADETKTPWSATFVTTPVDKYGYSRITFQLLMENSTTIIEQDYFVPGVHFCFFEGQKIVATGIVI